MGLELQGVSCLMQVIIECRSSRKAILLLTSEPSLQHPGKEFYCCEGAKHCGCLYTLMQKAHLHIYSQLDVQNSRAMVAATGREKCFAM